MFRRVIVANRGEIARRIIRTLQRMKIESVAVYSDADRNASYLAEATKSICIGPASAQNSYLMPEAILEAALQTDAEAIHPGFGFLSENAIFAERCLAQKLAFIGPSPKHIALMGDKARARQTMANLGVKTLVGSKGVITNLKEAMDLAERAQYPILLKARAGGGGKGMRLVHKASDLKAAYAEAELEASSAFGDGALYLEKFVTKARHIEFQVLGDSYGNVVTLGERECSIQRKNQKLIEEAPANGFPTSLRSEMTAKLNQVMTSIGYYNAGTVEFLLSEEGELYFMEMNTRLQVEHPVTELIYGVDIVELQVRIACMEKLPFKQEDLQMRGAAIECRINAENPADDFLPSPGLIHKVDFPAHQPSGPLRIDTHIEKGSMVSPYYDSMLAKIIAYGPTRGDALALMKQALDQSHLQGVETTISFHKAILSTEAFALGKYDCSFIEKNLPSLIKNQSIRQL
jgi:acetyl-CoA carboxylase biotin carboxylase subunit